MEVVNCKVLTTPGKCKEMKFDLSKGSGVPNSLDWGP